MKTLNTIARYKSLLKLRLSAQERAVLVRIIRVTGFKKFFVTQIYKAARIKQTNQLHAILGQLVKKGILIVLGRAEYHYKDPELVEHIKYRCLRIFN